MKSERRDLKRPESEKGDFDRGEGDFVHTVTLRGGRWVTDSVFGSLGTMDKRE